MLAGMGQDQNQFRVLKEAGILGTTRAAEK
jgi:hypothetical protein